MVYNDRGVAAVASVTYGMLVTDQGANGTTPSQLLTDPRLAGCWHRLVAVACCKQCSEANRAVMDIGKLYDAWHSARATARPGNRRA